MYHHKLDLVRAHALAHVRRQAVVVDRVMRDDLDALDARRLHLLGIILARRQLVPRLVPHLRAHAYT